MAKPRVLYITANFPQLSETYIKTELEAIQDGFEVFLICRKSANLPYATKQPYEQTKDWDRTLEIVEDFKPQVMHCHWVHLTGLMHQIAEKTGIPFTVRTHSFDVLGKELSSRVSLRHFKAINSGWKAGRAVAACFDRNLHRPDHELKTALDAVFGSDSADPVGVGIATGLDQNPAEIEIAGSDASSERRRLLEGNAYGDKSRPPRERIEIVKQLINESPDDPKLLFLLGVLQRRHGDVEGATISLRNAIDLDSSFAPVHAALGSLYARQGKLDEAIAAIERAVELEPKYVTGHRQLSQLYPQQGRIDEAISATRKVLEEQSADSSLHSHLASLLERNGALDEAIAAQLQAANLGMDGPGVYLKLATLLARQGHYAEAIKCANRAAVRYAARRVLGKR